MSPILPKFRNYEIEKLSNSYKKAVTIVPNFTFPFYGQPLKNVTVATGGFIFVGGTLHSQLTATQYIAPLMAGFDTWLSNSSFVQYFTNETHFVVQWLNMRLQNQSTIGSFSFQATLHKNGEIAFVYKNVPIPPAAISTEQHPVKLGISDAYVTYSKVFFLNRKKIYEYHRIMLNQDLISNLTAAILTPRKLCNTVNDCNSCLTAVTSFACKWCESVKRCSDGFDRNREQWLNSNCDKQENFSCNGVENKDNTTIIAQQN
ncbi:Plexin domain-containing protein 2-like protein [Leptotrombidium deliense]|uniref:Plexin domain-containing protein 2-like protein n=1 Tax=Leptotrombidium deliense TaxID=299467 RepID=A0A443S7N6_9ACAR|nr:Plexin domain-containing protein 2-like protein [Leptotrombidium deliense]